MSRIERGLSAPALIAGGAAALSAAAALWHARAGDAPPSFDAAWYLENSFRFYHALREGGLPAFYAAYVDAFRFKAPLLSVLPLPFYYLLGPSHDAALLVNLPATGLLAFHLFRLGRRLGSETAGALAAVIGLTTPMLFGLSRRFLVEYWLAALVTMAFEHLLRSDALRRPESSPRLGALLGAGLLLKSLFPFYLAAPVADALLERWRAAPRAFLKELEPPLKTIAAVAGAIALTWYGPNLLYVAGYLFRASYGDIAVHYGSPRVFDPDVLSSYLSLLVNHEISAYYVLAAAAVAAGLLARYGSRAAQAWREPGLRRAFLWLCFPILVATFGVNKDPRFTAPSLPALALLLGLGLDRLTRGWRRRAAALSLFFALPVAQFLHQTFGLGLPALTAGPLELLRPHGSYSGPPAWRGQWGQQELVDRIHQDTGGRPAVVVLGLENIYMNANTLACFSARRNYPLQFIHYGHEERRIERAIARLRERDADFLLFIEGIPRDWIPESAFALDEQLRRLVGSGRLPFAQFREYRLPGGLTARLYARTGTIRLFGAPPGAA